MPRRPISILLVGWLFVALGMVSLARGAVKYTEDREAGDLAIVAASALVAVAGGVLLLRGFGWGRWILLTWLAFHVALGAHHDLHSTALHALLFLVLAWLMFRASAAADFRSAAARRR